MMWRYRLRTARYGAQQNGKKDNEYGFFLLETLVAVSLATIVLTVALYSSSHVISAYTERVYDEELTMDTEFIESILIYRLRHARLKAVGDTFISYVDHKGIQNGVRVDDRKVVKVLSNATYQTITTDRVSIVSSPTPYFQVRQGHVIVHITVRHVKSKRLKTIDIDMVPRNGVPLS